MKILSKFRENVGLQAYHLGSVLNRSFPVFLKKIERTGTVGPLEPVTVQSGSRSHSGPTNRTLKHYYQLSWMWLVPHVGVPSNVETTIGKEEFNGTIRAEWPKARARMLRWNEELLIVQEEMRRAIVYLNWKAV